MTITFTIILPPVAQARHKSRAIRRADGNWTATTYKAAKQKQEENKLLALLYEHRPPEPLQGPIALLVHAFLPIPKSMSKKRVEMALAGILRPTTKPDLSNLLKQIEDVMNGIFWVDDKQIVAVAIEKFYGDPPRWEIRIEELRIW